MLLFYERPVVLNRDRHRNLRLVREKARFEFTRHTNSVPLVGAELAQCAGMFPIVFAGPTLETLMPMALVGVRNAENLFVDDGGGWQADFIPAFVRRYPFALAETADPDGEKYTVCFDEDFTGLREGEEGVPLFDDHGEPSAFLSQALDFLRQYQGQAQETRRFMEALRMEELLVERRLDLRRPSGEQLYLEGMHVVTEERLRALSDGRVTEWFRNGYLSWIMAHLVSLSRVSALASRLDEREGPVGGVRREGSEHVAQG